MLTNPSAQTGATSEVVVELDLLRRGFNVARPLVTARYDLIAVDAKGEMYRVQTKTGRIDGRNGTLKASWDAPYTPQECDVIAVVDLDADVVYYVPATRLEPGASGLTIRFEKTTRETSSFVASEVDDWPKRFASNERSEVSE